MNVNRPMRLITTALLAPAVLGLAACGSDNAVPADSSSSAAAGQSQSNSAHAELSGSIAGAGASSQEAAMKAWIAKYQSTQPGVSVTYEPVGSGAGITQFNSQQVLWAGSDAPLEGDEIEAAQQRCYGSPAIDLPVYISPVAVIFNLPGIQSLNLEPEVIAKIFSGEITKWNDPAIAATNQGVDLPDLAITPVHRADKSGTTENFTDYLHQAAPEAWPHKADKSWPISAGESGDKTSGLVQAVQQGEGTIGYADASQAGSLGVAALKAGDGYVKYSTEAAAKAVDAAGRMEGRADGDIALKLARVPDAADAYPLVLVSYSIACSTYETEDQANLVKDFLTYQVSAEGQEAAAKAAGSAPLSDSMRKTVMESINKISVKK